MSGYIGSGDFLAAKRFFYCTRTSLLGLEIIEGRIDKE